MKKTMIALMALAGVAMADTTTTYTPLDNASDWELGSVRHRANVTIEDGFLYNNSCNWGQDYAIYTFDTPLTLSDVGDKVDFSYTFATGGSVDAAVTLALISTSGKTVVVGMGGNAQGYSQAGGAVSYGVTDTPQGIYTFEGVPASGTLTTMGATDFKNIGGSISITETGAVATFGSDTIALGSDFELSKLYISYDCASSTTTRPVVSNLTVVHTDVVSTPEPATATLSLLALAGLASRRRRH